ncbi:DUF2599 domain-containing protein [Pseudomonas corrugata]|uniref:DUF2599 domain-containing protein n=1 Tax=Pseudomonas corrugata TaxID=47879 RepID=UPI0015864FC2|nr:DUF2599 domain-containing protein [Pseudomonas corrugata]MCI0995964.1 DUF2599 domain-containing protein [Pseudomonas corrugata]NUT68388.1 DUF2599 domain-containing protein [Pseudomonas corrugata]
MRFYILVLLFIVQASYGGEGVCTQYIESATWAERYDPGTQKNEWSLSVIPTACGRAIQSDQTNAEYAELVQKFGNDWQWKNNDGGGMRRQLVCHLTIARSKTPWNLEPYRPDVTHEVSIQNGCNYGVAPGNGMIPAPPLILNPTESNTVVTPFLISGKSAAGAVVDVCLEGGGYCFGKPTADGNGDWFIEGAQLSPGSSYRMTARQTLGGKVSNWADYRTFSVP